MHQINAGLLKTKHHFEILDGLRGIAAIAIVVFHFMEMVYTDYSNNFIGHGFLAVDFFFCLSGFVIGYAYDDRIAKMGVWEFFKSRLIRLHPMIIAGSVVGICVFIAFSVIHHEDWFGSGRIILAFLGSCFLIPLPIMPERGFALFGLNALAWSLFLEYIANIVYAFILYKIGKRFLLVLAILAAAVLCFVGHHSGTLMGGWDAITFPDGFARVSYSFLAGLLVYRFNWIVKTKLGFISLSALLLAALLMPYVSWSWLAEPIVVIMYFPFLIALGAGATLTKRFKKWCTFLGNLSYPLYMTHMPFLWFFGYYYNQNKPDATELFWVISIGTLLLIGFAYVVMKVYDIPLRKYLTEKRNVA
ncbi:MAG: acyltransferase [Cytophagales bacterium]|nr:acyltransferase [Cytophaga sp.]